MNIRKSIPLVTAMAVIGSLVFTGCANTENVSGSSEPTDVTTTTEAQTKDTSEETTEAPVSGNDAEDTRYKLFLEGQYKDQYAKTLSAPLMDGEDTEGDMYTYTDLDGDGSNELLIGNSENSVYLIVSEKSGSYCVTETYTVKPMGGLCASLYLGNGCFAGTHNVPDKSYMTFFRYNGETGYCDFLAGLWKVSNGDSVTFELFKAKDDKDTLGYHSYNELNIDRNDTRYDHKTKDFKADEALNTEGNELYKEYSEYMSSISKGSSPVTFDWKPL